MRTIFVFAWARCPDSSLIHLKIRTPPPPWNSIKKYIYLISPLIISQVRFSVMARSSLERFDFPGKEFWIRACFIYFFFALGGGGVDIQNIFSEIQIIPLGYINFDPLTPDNTWLGFQQMYTINVISWYG